MRLSSTPNDLSAHREFCAAVLHGARRLSPNQIRALADRLHELARTRQTSRFESVLPPHLRQDEHAVWL